MHPPRGLGGVALVLALLAMAGCGSSPSEQPDSADSGQQQTATPGGTAGPAVRPESESRPESEPGNGTAAPPAVVPAELDFAATEVSGQEFDARDLAGADVVFWFWAPWCTVCAGAAADVASAVAAHPGVEFVGVAGSSSDVESMQTFVDQHDLRAFPQLADTDGSLYTRFGVTQQHTFVLVGADGTTETLPAYGGSVDLDATIDNAFG